MKRLILMMFAAMFLCSISYGASISDLLKSSSKTYLKCVFSKAREHSKRSDGSLIERIYTNPSELKSNSNRSRVKMLMKEYKIISFDKKFLYYKFDPTTSEFLAKEETTYDEKTIKGYTKKIDRVRGQLIFELQLFVVGDTLRVWGDDVWFDCTKIKNPEKDVDKKL